MTFFQRIKLFFHQLFHGLRAAEDVMLTQDTSDGGNVSVVQKQESKTLAEALINGEVTQEVRELRYRTYKVDRESRGYEFVTGTLGIKKDTQLNSNIVYENSEDLDLILVQPNHEDKYTADETLSVGDDEAALKALLGTMRLTLNLTYDKAPRYNINRFITRLVYRNRDGRNVIDLYVNKYPIKGDILSTFFTKEISKYFKDVEIDENGKAKTVRESENVGETKDYTLSGTNVSMAKRYDTRFPINDFSSLKVMDFIQISNIDFVTYKAYNSYDGVYFRFKDFKFYDLLEFDGHYILRYEVSEDIDIIDAIKQYDEESMIKKYEDKAPKKVDYHYDFGQVNKKEYVCEECGAKTVKGELVTYIDEEGIEEEIEDTTYIDYEIAMSMHGRCLCSSCLNKVNDYGK